MHALKLPDFQPQMPANSPFPLLAAPIRNRGKTVGSFFLREENRGKGFAPQDDEETLVMLPSQAALVTANARTLSTQKRPALARKIPLTLRQSVSLFYDYIQ